MDLNGVYGQNLIWANPQEGRQGSVPTVQGSTPGNKNGGLSHDSGFALFAFLTIFLA